MRYEDSGNSDSIIDVSLKRRVSKTSRERLGPGHRPLKIEGRYEV